MPKLKQTTKEVIKEVAKTASKEEEKVVPMEQLVTFELDKEEYASVITDLREIIVVPEIIPIPNAPEFIKGILNLRGQIVLVLDLEKRFHLKRDHEAIEARHVIIIEVNENWYGVVVDEVTGVLRVPVDSIKPTPSLVSSKISEKFLKGVVILEQESEQEQGDAAESVSEEQKTESKSERITNQKTKKETKTKKEEKESSSRLILLIDFLRLLSEKELAEMGVALKQTAQEVDEN